MAVEQGSGTSPGEWAPPWWQAPDELPEEDPWAGWDMWEHDPSFGPITGGGWQPSTPGGEGYFRPWTGAFPWGPGAAQPQAAGGGGGGGGGWGGLGWGGWGGGGGGGGYPEPTPMAPWEGDIPLMNLWAPELGYEQPVPWGSWEETPWANLPEENQAMAQQWFQTLQPWFGLMAQQQRQRRSIASEEAMQQAALNFQRWQTQRQLENYLQQRSLESFGRRWAPNVRWA